MAGANAAQSLALVSVQQHKFEVPRDLVKATDSIVMQEYIKEQYAAVDIAETFRGLVDGGSLLQIALTAAGNQPCSVPVLKTLSKYQDLVADSTAASGAFTEGALSALRCHREAIEVFQDAKVAGDLTDGLEELESCAELASTMAAKSDELVNKVDKVIGLAEEGLLMAKQDCVNEEVSSKKIEADLAKLLGEKAGRDETLRLLEGDLNDAMEKEEKAAREAAQARDRQFGMDICNAVIGGVRGMLSAVNPISMMGSAVPISMMGSAVNGGPAKATASGQGGGVPQTDLSSAQGDDVRNKQEELVNLQSQLKSAESAVDKDTPDGKQKIEDLKEQIQKKDTDVKAAQEVLRQFSATMERRVVSLEEKEASASNMRQALAKEKREQAGQLAKNVAEIATMRKDCTQVEQTVKTLGACVRTMGSVKVTFVNSKLFWQMVASKCRQLSELKAVHERAGKRAKKDLDNGQVEKAKLKLTDHVEYSAKCWAGIGRVCFDAHTVINEAREKVNGVMTALPSGNATDQQIKKLTNEMTTRLRAISNSD